MTCEITGKYCHANAQAARNHIRSLVSDGKGDPARLAEYYCFSCGFWHVGNADRPKSSRERKAKKKAKR